MANNNIQATAIPNEINPNNLYGLNQPQQNTGCMQGLCPPNTIDVGYYIPSLQEIASYNLQAPSISQSSGLNQQNIPHQGSMTPMPNTSPYQTNMQGNNEVVSGNQVGVTSTSPPISFAEDTQAIVEEITPLPQTPATIQTGGATMSTAMRENLGMSVTDYANPYPVTAESIKYLNGFIRTQIGRRMTIDYIIGNSTISKSGYLLGVAQNYILINELDTNDITTCDFYNIKFIRFYY